jgi:putative endopeptidase
MGSRKRRTKKLRKTSRNLTLRCNIPIQAPAFNSLSKPSVKETVEADFYDWVNSKWSKSVSIPAFENDFGISEEVERCIFETSKRILLSVKGSEEKNLPEFERTLKLLSESCLHSAAQHQSVEFLEKQLHKLECIETKEQVVAEFSRLARMKFDSLFNFQYFIDKENKTNILLNPNVPSIHSELYYSEDIMKKYKRFLQVLEDRFHLPLTTLLEFERSLVQNIDSLWNEEKFKCTGAKLKSKFRSFPWESWFSVHEELKEWKKTPFYTCSPRWIRTLGRLLKEVPIEYWKLYLAKTWIVGSLKYLPPPFDEIEYNFFGKSMQGQRVKMPQIELLVNIVYDYFPDQFSELFWKHAGNEELEKEGLGFCESLRASAIEKLETVGWLHEKTKGYAIEKVKEMRIQAVKPKEWPTGMPLLQLSSTNLLENILKCGEGTTKLLFSRVGTHHTYWDEGIFRVNAYYFSENNEIVIPCGTMISPFYIDSKTVAWNYGALGSIIGHEICHAFDKDGHLYDIKGIKRNWWLPGDTKLYNQKAKELEELFSAQRIEGYSVDGKRTLSENFADLCGISISLHALKKHLEEQGADEKTVLEEYRKFFTAYAVSWRTRYRKEKLKTLLLVDVHAPAKLRVNVIVQQFQEWYDAFGVECKKERLEIF